MDYEKKYKEAVNKIKNLLDDGEKNGFTIVTYKTDLESIFPELKESEGEKIKEEIIDYLKQKYSDPNAIKYDYDKWIVWLEKQGESYTKRDVDDAYIEGMACAKNELEKQSEQKSTWSEEDEKMIRGLIVICDEWTTRHSFYPIENCEIEKLKNWLEFLKERYTWKPSNEQLEALKDAIRIKPFENPSNNPLWGLYEQLKKLIGG